MHDFVVIGSGVSGGRMAWELVRGGANCLLLEAGREFGAKTFPSEELDYSTQMFWGGGLELSSDGHIGFLRAKCLGGTSIVNQALLDRFDDLAWDSWRARSGVGFFNSRDMEAHYAACASELSISEIPKPYYNRNAEIFCESFDRSGYRWKPLERAQKDCKLGQGTDCIVCLGGCPLDSKQSALVTVIRSAREQGLEVRSEFEVDRIEYAKDEVKVIGSWKGAPAEVKARKVVLAAGAFGNSTILLRSGLGKSLPALGKGISCHPQFMTYAFFDEPVNAHKGAFQAVKGEDDKLRKAGLKLENVFAPPIGTAMLLPGVGRDHHRLMKKYRYLASAEVAIQDDAVGRVTVGSGGKMKVDKVLTATDRAKVKVGLAIIREIFAGSGAKEIIDCPQTFGLHLMGGCPIGTDASTSVVSPEFTVHDHSNLFAADSSVYPAAPGINPSFTIMALSHRAAGGMLR